MSRRSQRGVEDRAVAGFRNKLDDRLGNRRADPVDIGQRLETLAFGRGGGRHRRPPVVDGAIAAREQTRRRLTDVADSQCMDETVERDAPARFDRAEEVGGGGLAPALALGERCVQIAVLRLNVEDVRRALHAAFGPERLDLLGAEALDIEGVPGDEMAQPLQRLGRADQTAGAAAHRFALLPHRVAAALRADGGRNEGLAPGRPPLFDYPDHLRDHVAGALDDDRIAGADVLAGDLILVVERRAGDGDATDMHRLELGDRSQRAGASDRDRDAVQNRLGLLGRELVSDGPAGRPAGGAQTLLPVEAVDLEHDTVDLEVERGPHSLDLPMERTRIVKTGATPGVRGEREPPRREPRENVGLALPQRLACLAPAVGEEAQPALRGERRVDLPQAAGGGVARIDECLFAFRLPLPVQRREIGEPYVDLAPDFQPLRHVGARQRVRQVAHGTQVGGHILAGLAVAPGGAEDKPAPVVMHCRREAVDLGLAVEHHRLVPGQIEEAPDPALELGEVIVIEGVAEREHGPGVADLGEARGWRRAHTVARAVGALEVGEARFDGLVAAPQRVVFGIAQLRRGAGVVELVVAPDFLRQTRQLALRRIARERLRRRGVVAHSVPRASRLSAAARASSVTFAPESIRAISSRRWSSVSNRTRAVAPCSPLALGNAIVTIAAGGDLGRMGHHQDLNIPCEPRQTLADGIGDGAADTAVDLVEDEGREAGGTREADL